MSNTVHDMGGMHGFGPVVPEPNEPPFHEFWESRVFAMQRAMGYTSIVDDRCGPRVARNAATAALSRLLLLPALVSRTGASAAAARTWSAATRSPPGKSLRPAVGLNRKLTVGEVDRVKVRGNFERTGPDASEIQGRRPSPRPKHQPEDAYAPAALCEGQDRHSRGNPGLPRLPGHGGAGCRRRIRSGSIRSCSPAASCGATTPTPRPRSRSKRSSHISIRHERRGCARSRVAGDENGPVFREPWEAQAFALTVSLYRRGLFTWPEWAATLAEEIKRAQAGRRPRPGDTYYRHWLAALERIVAEKGLSEEADLARYRAAWDHAAGAHAARRADRPAAGRFLPLSRASI